MLKLFFLLIFFILLVTTEIQAHGARKICKTEECKKSANNLKACINESVDPCDNFFQYACGNFASVLDKDESANDFFDRIQNKITQSVKKVLNDRKKHPSKAVETAKQFYKLCLDTDTMNSKGLAPLQDILRRIGLPTKSPLAKPSHRFDWVSTAAKMKKVLNMDFLISVDIMADPKNRSRNLISVSKPSDYSGTGPDYSNYLRSTFRNNKIKIKRIGPSDALEDLGKELNEYIRSVSNVFDRGSKKPSKSYKRKLKMAITQLALSVYERILMQYKNRPDEIPVPKLLTLDELQNYTDSSIIGLYKGKLVLDWKRYITTLFEGVNVNLDLESGTDKISVSDMGYLKEAVRFMEQNQKLLESALWWDVIQQIGPFTTDELRELDNTYREEGLGSPREISDLCQGVVRRYFSFALAHTFSTDPKVTEYERQTEEMLNNLRLGFDKIVEKSNWMDANTKAIAKEKSKAMRSYISHPDWLSNITEVDSYYEEYTIYQKDFLKTIYLIEQEIVKSNLNSLREENDLESDTYDSYPLVTNAFYSSSDNTMTIPMGIIQFPFMGHPIQALNYGALGVIVGHEITHGFDTEGKRHDQIGNIRRWWQNDTLEEYKNRTSCFVESYKQIEINGENVDGILTLDENIADNGGYKESLLAYRHYVKTNGTEPLLEGFEGFTDEQLFTLSFANSWCAVTSEVSFIDTHSPNEARILGVLKNSREFQEIWKCKKGSPMNPEEKCQLW